MTARLLLAVGVACLLALTACGGGDPEDIARDVPVPHVDCQARPEGCK